MARFGIETSNALGISVSKLRKLAREIGPSHALAQELWESGIHEARGLAALIDEPKKVTEHQMERWVRAIDSWDICDGCCGNLFDKTPFAYRKAVEWSRREEEEYVKRAGFALMAWLAVHDKKASDAKFLRFLPIIRRESTDERNFVRKAVNWALRQTGKRSPLFERSRDQNGTADSETGFAERKVARGRRFARVDQRGGSSKTPPAIAAVTMIYFFFESPRQLRRRKTSARHQQRPCRETPTCARPAVRRLPGLENSARYLS
jgi:3-methyladenine DNA glycosylase AlkD